MLSKTAKQIHKARERLHELLDERNEEIVRLRTIGLSSAEVGRRYGITRQCVEMIEVKARLCRAEHK